MAIVGIIAFAIIMFISHKNNIEMDTAEFWFYRVLTALAAAAISISLPGMLKINYTPKGEKIVPMTLAEKEPTITASGAIAIFVLVYLFNPIG